METGVTGAFEFLGRLLKFWDADPEVYIIGLA